MRRLLAGVSPRTKDIFLAKPLSGRGPKALASEHVIQTYVIPKFSKSQDTAKEFLLYLADHASDFVYQSKLYEFPVNPTTNAQDKLYGSGGCTQPSTSAG